MSIAVAESPEGRNRLGAEKSPYLLQHKDNPVWWWAWSDEAFEAAIKQDKPIFLSIGYSTCHWCHVMEHESFEDQEVADYLNENFVSIKVDREELPDVDKVYMETIHVMSGRGGWPMTAFLNHERKAFFGATYFPKDIFLNVLSQVIDKWSSDRDWVNEISDNVVKTLDERFAEVESKVDGMRREFLGDAMRQMDVTADMQSGGFGFGKPPKFPPSVRLRLLMRLLKRTGYKKGRKILKTTLTRMAYGGIHDHIGGGFHRYATDKRWMVPHFEKMLYDNALLALTYTEAFQQTSNDMFRDVAEGILGYVLRDMTSKEGGFYSAEDADSEGEEGTFYVWQHAELQKALSVEDLKIAEKLFGITPAGNFENNKSIVHLKPAHKWMLTRSADYKRIKKILFDLREKRTRPLRDDKVLTAWNGLMISAMSKAYRVMGDERYLVAARQAAGFILKNLYQDGKLLRRYRDGEARFDGVLDDYAYFIDGLIELYQASADYSWLQSAIELQKAQDALLWDAEAGGYTYSRAALFYKLKEYGDNARPSGNGVAALNLLRLSDYTYDKSYAEKAEAIFRAASGLVPRSAYSFSMLLIAFDYYNDRARQVVLTGADESGELRRYLDSRFLPNMIVAFAPSGGGGETPKLVTGKKSIDGKSTVYVCEQGSCKEPTSDLSVMAKQLSEISKFKIVPPRQHASHNPK